MCEISFAIGRHRPVYFWAGPTTVRMNRLKFMGAPVNEAVHLEGHTPQLHLVNYADAPQDVGVTLPWTVRVQVISPDTGQILALEGRSLRLSLDVYAVVLCEGRPCTPS